MSEDYRFNNFKIPSYGVETLKRYVNMGIPCDSFVQAVIDNDLCAAVGRADFQNIHNIPAYISWLYNNAPAGSWGFEGAHERWVSGYRAKKDADNNQSQVDQEDPNT